MDPPWDAERTAAFLRANSPFEVETDGSQLLLLEGERRRAKLAVASTLIQLNVEVDAAPAEFTPDEAAELVAALVGLAREMEQGAISLATLDPTIRDEARTAGLTGPIRQRLTLDVTGGAGPAPALDLAGRLEDLVPGVAVRPLRPPGALRRLAHAGTWGFPGMRTLMIDTGGRPLRVALPDRDDVLVERLAEAVDTSIAVRRRFERSLAHVRVVSFDHSDQGLAAGRYAGIAHSITGVIHLNANLVLRTGPPTLARQRESAERKMPTRSAPVSPPFTGVDGTVAHEWWHQIDAHFQARRYRESIEFRRQLGRYFGVETIEHATAVQAHAPESWKAAHERFAAEVSSYGGTNPKEATAELFKLWWCNIGEPSPVVRLFGELLVRYFGVTKDR